MKLKQLLKELENINEDLDVVLCPNGLFKTISFIKKEDDSSFLQSNNLKYPVVYLGINEIGD